MWTRSDALVQYRHEFAGSGKTRANAAEGTIWRAGLPLGGLIEKLAYDAADLVLRIEPSDGINSGPAQKRGGLPCRIGQGDYRALTSQIFVDLCRYLIIAVRCLQDDQAVGSEHLPQRRAIGNRRGQLHHVGEPEPLDQLVE